MTTAAPAVAVVPATPPAESPPTNAPGATVMIENIQLEAFERAVYSRDHEQASQLLLQALRRMKLGGEFIGYQVRTDLRAILYTRFCSAVIALLADPTYNISQEGFDNLASEHAILDLAFRQSVFGTSDHLLAQLATNPTEGDPNKLQIANGPSLVKFLLTYSLRSGFAMDFETTFAKAPQVVFSLWAGMLSALLTIDEKAQYRIESMLGMHRMFEDVKVSAAVLPTLSDAYMYSSYALRPDKHDMKATVHRLFARFAEQNKVPLPKRERVHGRRKVRHKRDKPVIVVCLEWFGRQHSMYRCYASIIRQLRSRFHLVGMSRAQDIDDVGKAEFDRWLEVPHQNMVLAHLVQQVTDLEPDMIYYPSLGMAMWWVTLASLRLAPIQFMTLGHPASSRSPHMDYVVCEEGSIGDPTLFSERIVTMPFGAARYELRNDAAPPDPAPIETAPSRVHVAVPAMLCKLNARFMAALRRIHDAVAARQDDGELVPAVQFHFFPNMSGSNLHQAAAEIRDYLPTALVYERADYATYMGNLRRCHLHLASFPFGGTNSNVDSMLMGIPVLAMEGQEPHERFDALQLRHAGLGDKLIARDVDDYVSRAVDLIVDHERRNALRADLLATDLDTLFFGEPPEHCKGGFLAAVGAMFDDHEAMQASRDRVFRTAPGVAGVMAA